jgi:hypothetical protein
MAATGTGFTTTNNHIIQNGYATYTPGSAENITDVGFHSDGSNGNGTMEIGVYRVDTLAKVASANVSNTGSGRFTASLSGALSAGVAYCVAWRCVANTASYNVYQASAAALSALDGTSALANPFSTAGGTYNQNNAVFAITAAAGGGGGSPLIGRRGIMNGGMSSMSGGMSS